MTRAKRARLAAAVVAAFILQAAFGGDLAVAGIRPNLALTTLSVACIFVGPVTGALLGFLCGLLEASFAALFVGSYLVTRSVAGWAVGALEERVFRDNLVFAAITTFLVSLLAEVAFFLFAPQPDAGTFALATLGAAAYNGVLAVPVYLLVRRSAGVR